MAKSKLGEALTDSYEYNSAGREKTPAERWFERLSSVCLFVLFIAIKFACICGGAYLTATGHPWLGAVLLIFGITYQINVRFTDD